MTGSAAPELKVRLARDTLARQLMSPDWRSGFVDQASLDQDSVHASRPGESRTDENRVDKPGRCEQVVGFDRHSLAKGPSRHGGRGFAVRIGHGAGRQGAGSDDRTLLQKLSDLLPGNVKLASLAPDGGLVSSGTGSGGSRLRRVSPRFTTSRRMRFTCQADLSLEAHSGMGSLKDDPEHVSVRDGRRGATCHL